MHILPPAKAGGNSKAGDNYPKLGFSPQMKSPYRALILD
jgi:hypothetical protein